MIRDDSEVVLALCAIGAAIVALFLGFQAGDAKGEVEELESKLAMVHVMPCEEDEAFVWLDAPTYATCIALDDLSNERQQIPAK